MTLIDDQETIWSENFGYRDLANKLKADKNTRYRAGSITKLFTVTAIMQLAEKGMLNIDKPLSTYLTDFKIKNRYGSNNDITLRNIMSHHSGLPSDYLDNMFNKKATDHSVLLDLIKQEHVKSPTNTYLSYSNIGMSLLGLVIERASGETYQDYIHKHILSPCDMHQSKIDYDLTGDNIAFGYNHNNPVNDTGLRDIAAGGLNTSTEDLASFIKMVFAEGKCKNNRVISAESLNETLSVQNKNIALDLDLQIGLGWFFYNNKLLKVGPLVGHGGATLGHRGIILLAPEHKMAVAILSNSTIHQNKLNDIAVKALQLVLEAKTGLMKMEPTPRTYNTQLKPGFYASLLGLTHIYKDDNQYKASVMDETFSLSLSGNGLYYPKYKLLDLFEVDIDELSEIGLQHKHIEGHDVLLGHVKNNMFIAGTAIKPKNIPDIWKTYLGEYQIDNDYKKVTGLTALNLVINNSFLCLKFLTPDDSFYLPLEIINDTEAIKSGIGRGFGETVTVEKTENDLYLKMSGMRFKKSQALKNP